MLPTSFVILLPSHPFQDLVCNLLCSLKVQVLGNLPGLACRLVPGWAWSTEGRREEDKRRMRSMNSFSSLLCVQDLEVASLLTRGPSFMAAAWPSVHP